MDFLTYLAVLVATTLIQRALAPKIRTPMPALEDFQVPTAEYGRSIPWLFGTRKIKDPNIIWYGDLDRHGKTKDGAKYYTYYMGLHLEICIGPVDKVTAIDYGEKRAWTGEVTSSGQITISQPKLYGGRYKEGGIDGYFDLCFGESAQAVNSYLQAQLGTPLSAFRDSFCIVGRKPSLVANSTLIRPIQPTVCCITAGWPDDTCWYPETAIIPENESTGYCYDEYCSSTGGGISLDYWWSLAQDLSAGNASNKGVEAGGTLVLKSHTSGATFNATPVTLNTENNGAMYRNGATGNGWMNVADIAVQPLFPFTAGVWFNLHSQTEQILFKSNVGGTQGYWRGVDIYAEGTSRISVVLGDGIGGSYRLQTPADTITGTGDHFVVLYCDPGLSLMGTVASLKLYIDGELQPLTHYAGSATSVAWPISASNPSGWTGIAFDWSGGDTYGKQPEGTRDEPFFHWGELSAGAILEMYRRGSGVCGGGQDMNPAHIIYKVWVDTHQGMAEDPANIDAVAMAYAADIFFDERTGLSMYWARQCAIEEFIGEVCRHAGALQTINPRTGQLKIVALRDDYDISSLDALTEDDVIEVVEWQDAADGEAVNTITVRWVDRDGAAQATTYTNRASVQQHGVIAETRDYPGIATEALARRVAKRDVKEASSNLAKGKIKVNRAGWDKFPGDVFIFSHAPEGIEEIVLRVLEIDTGTLTDGAITLTVVQDVFSLPLDVPEISEQGNEWTTPSTAPAEATTATLMELPYWALLDALGVAETGTLGDGAGYLAALAAKPTPLTTDIDIWARISPASYAEVRPEQVCAPSAMLASALDRATDTDIQLDDLSQIEDVEVDWLVQIGTGALAELCRVTAIDADAATVSVDRAILDTTPQTHDAATPLFFLPPSASDWALDPTQYADSDTVDVKLQTGTASGEIDISTVTAISATMASRQARPYPPGNLEINSEAYPTLLLGPLTVTWAERDRVVQGTTIISQDDATDYGPESGTTYNCYAYDDSDDTLLDSDTGISAATWSPVITTSCDLRIEIEAERDGYVSWQRQVRSFTFIADRARIVVSGDPRETATGNIRDTTG